MSMQARNRKETANTRRDTHRPEMPLHTSTWHVLIADDDALSRFLMLRLLQKHLPEARILQAASGSDTLQIWQQHRPRIILMDLEMPGMNGLDIAAAIRAAETDAGAAAADRPSAAPPSRIIVVSGSCCSDIQDEMRQHGIHAVLEKPVEPAALLSTVHTCLADSTL